MGWNGDASQPSAWEGMHRIARNADTAEVVFPSVVSLVCRGFVSLGDSLPSAHIPHVGRAVVHVPVVTDHLLSTTLICGVGGTFTTRRRVLGGRLFHALRLRVGV